MRHQRSFDPHSTPVEALEEPRVQAIRQPLKPVQVIFGSMSVSTLDARHSTLITNKAATIRALYQDRINPKSFKRKACFGLLS